MTWPNPRLTPLLGTMMCWFRVQFIIDIKNNTLNAMQCEFMKVPVC